MSRAVDFAYTRSARWAVLFATIAIAINIPTINAASDSHVNVGTTENDESHYDIARFLAPNGQVSLDVYTKLKDGVSSLHLVQVKDKRTISILPLSQQKTRSFEGSWSPDSAFVALSFKPGETNNLNMLLFKIEKGIHAVKLPASLSLKNLLPRDDPARNAPLLLVVLYPVRWRNSSELVCTVMGVARLSETPVVKAGYLSISYDVVLRRSYERFNVRTAVRTLYVNNDEDNGDSLIGRGIQPAEDKMDLRSLVNLGWSYQEGIGVPRDDRKAVELYTKAANAGFAPGQAYLATQYAAGRGVEQDYNKAISLFEKAIAQDDPQGLNEFAWFLATCPNDSQRNGARAIDYARKACDLTRWTDKNFVETLAAAYAESGDFERAVMYQQQALTMPGDYPSDGDMTKALRGYQQHKPLREPLPQSL